MTESIKGFALEEIEGHKDLMDLKPNLDYVIRHLAGYEASLQRLMVKTVPEDNIQRLAQVEVSNVVEDYTLQIAPKLALDVLSYLPQELLRISGLKELNYRYQRLVPIPNFNEDGFVDSKNACVGTVSADTFPIEKAENGDTFHHPTRILIGNTDQGIISPSYLPKTVCENKRAVEIYQIHVLLHEFFHTISEKFRTEEKASKLIIHFTDSTSMTFAQWRKAIIDSMLEIEPVYTSSYAATYSDQIKSDGLDLTSYGVEEQLCETFTAYILGRAPGKVEYDDFTTFDFGNKHPERQLIKGYGSIRHELIDRFFSARFEVIN